MDSTTLITKIGLEIHVQLKTKSKMFCGCDNQSFAEATDGKQCAVEPNTLVCPVCLGMPGSLPVANKQAIEWTIKTGLALNCEIPKIAKFDRKHYFYPDLPKGYQISQYDEPFCIGGYVELNGSVISSPEGDPLGRVERSFEKISPTTSLGRNDNVIKINLTRIHLEEDAGKLIHRDGKSLVDLNRAGTPLMEIVSEPDITSPKMAGDFLRKLQKIVRDQVEVSDADMEKGHLRCDANISLCENSKLKTQNSKVRMSPIIEIKNINSFKFVEKALALAEEKLKAEYVDWPEGKSKETWGYDSVNNKVYLQRRKEEAADYRYFPEPDLPPFDSTKLNLEELKSGTKESHDEKTQRLNQIGVAGQYASILVSDPKKCQTFEVLNNKTEGKHSAKAAKLVAEFTIDESKIDEFAHLISKEQDFQKSILVRIIELINSGKSANEAIASVEGGLMNEDKLNEIVAKVLKSNQAELSRYKSGEKKLFGFFMGLIMKETNNSANPQELSRILKEKLEQK